MDLTIPILAAVGGHGEVIREWTASPGEVAWKMAVIMFFVLLNGFFVAAEFAIVKVRSSQIDSLIEAGKKRAVFARHVTDHLDAYLSATQLGITLASLALGWLGEPYIGKLIEPLMFMAFGPDVSEALVSKFAFGIAFAVITFLHIVLGELMPKSLAIRKAIGTTMFVARPLGFFYLLFKLPIILLNGTANKLLKLIFKIEPVGESELLHSADELRLLVQETEKSEEVTPTEREILIAALELNDLHVRDVLTPRADVTSLDPSKDFQENLDAAIESGHTRFPLVDGHLDSALGLIHLKDILRLMRDEAPDLYKILRPLPTVPEMMALDDLLKLFLKQQVHMALVVDEFGGTLGIVTLDNVIEELVGDIHDEFDEDDSHKEFFQVSDDEFTVVGSLPLYELWEKTELKLDSPDVSTIGGFVTHLLGHLPEEGESVEIEGWEATVTETDGKSVGRLRFVRVPDPGARDVAEPASAEGGADEPSA